MASNEKIYTQSEIAQVIGGLTRIYYMQPFWMKPFWKKWLWACEVMYASFCGADTNDVLNQVEDFLDKEV